jgi:hypothetical protein
MEASFHLLASMMAIGAEGSRTPDLNNANVAFYQLNYGPVYGKESLFT